MLVSPPNTSDNEYFGDVVRQALSRRSLFKAAGIAVLAVSSGSALAACNSGSKVAGQQASSGCRAAARMNFTAIAPNKKDAVVVPEGYRQAVVISWGDPVLPGLLRSM